MTLKDTDLIKYNNESIRRFQKSIDKAIKKVGDLKPAFNLIVDDFHISEQAIFNLQGPGGYPDFKTEESKAAKVRAVGFDYPLLLRGGAMEKSLTNRNAEGSIAKAAKTFALVGSSIPYVVYHNSDQGPRKKIPQRKVVFIGPETEWFHAKDRAKGGGRLTRWSGIIEETVVEKLRIMGG